MRKIAINCVYVSALFFLSLICVSEALSADEGEVRAVFFFSPNCPHCHTVVAEDFPPLVEQYGDRLNIIGINTSVPEGDALFKAVIERFEIPGNRQGVPMLVVGDFVLISPQEISPHFPELVAHYLADGGVDWPAIPGIEDILKSKDKHELTDTSDRESHKSGPGAEKDTNAAKAKARFQAAASGRSNSPVFASREITLLEFQKPDLRARLLSDPIGNSIAIAALIGMIWVVIYTVATFRRPVDSKQPAWRDIWIPLLSVVGLVAAGYLAYVDASDVPAICGPIGNCNVVQQSSYARLFGLIPVSFLGVGGFLAVIGAWFVKRYAKGLLADVSALALFGMAMFGTLFSIYLTFLELFVIGATCMWCVVSAVVTALLLWMTVPDGKAAIGRIAGR